ncbi:hypothetical protein QBC40DRAFT_7766 [Triangularia verruculosa]|uniref:Uncharacterized protein n=1 Tax=Triangularia verruculosa TaxID=2587418 RepID=A0AAN6XP64_9PEZI|nr:hypothetical protein QBC40DRAFT_7766 [Triangularia verruculosa]
MAYQGVFSGPPPSIIPSHMLASRGSAFDSLSDDSDIELPPLPTEQALVPAHTSQGNLASNVIPIGSHKSGIVLYSDTDLLGEGQQNLLYYSKNRGDRQRDTQSRSQHSGGYSRSFSSDTAKAYAIKTARYPVLYEMLKTPAAARRALESWKKAPMQAESGENSSETPITGDQDGGETASGHQAAPVSATSTALVTASGPHVMSLPPQHMTFSEPLLEKTRRGTRFVVTCELEKSYPNFHIQCEYIYINQQERVNRSQTDTRISLANISTKESLWVVAMEQTGYNEEFIRGLVGDEDYAKLNNASGPVRGHDKGAGPSVVAKVAKKITFPEGYDLGNIWCKAVGFYTLKIFVPSKEYKM